MYLLIDANVAAGYYLPRSLRSLRARARIPLLLDSIRSRASQHFLYIPNFCIAEVFSTFAKHSFGHWNPHVKKQGTIDSRVYRSVVHQFSTDIHNGAFFHQYELSRYHILGVDLVAPVDQYFQITKKKGRRHAPAGTMDHLIISMGIQLVHIHGQENVVLVTTDDRLARIVDKCRSGLRVATIKKLKLQRAGEITGKQFIPGIFPNCIDLSDAKVADLATAFGAWPPPTGPKVTAYRWLE
jgi:hypothetical protein